MALDAREKKLLLIPAGLALVLVFYSFVHQPLFTKRAEAADLSQKAAADLQKEQARLMKEGNIKSRQVALAAREKVIADWVPGKNSAALFIWHLSQAELASGVRIKGLAVGERKQMTATAQQGAQGGGSGGQAPEGGQGTNQGAQGAQSGQGGQGANPGANPGTPGATYTLTVIRLDLKVEGQFAQHLVFNQELESMELFLNADSLSLAKEAPLPMSEANELVQHGSNWLATQLLSASPDLSGTYQINLYFKEDKAGPTTDIMRFGSSAGRSNPYVPDGAAEMVKILEDYNREHPAQGDGKPSGSGNTGGNKNPTDPNGGKPGQLG